MRNKLLLTISLIFFLYFSESQIIQNQIQWRSFDEVNELMKTNPKKVFVEYTTSWCGWCRKMEAETFTNQMIASYINANYYAIKFNAEGSDTIIYKDSVYTNPGYDPLKKSGRNSSHDLAKKLMSGKMSYPTLGFLDEEMNILSNVPGFQKADGLLPILVYFAENLHKSVPWEEYNNAFSSTFDTIPETSKVNWLSLDEAQKKQKAKPKKIIILLVNEWSHTSKMMSAITFNDSVIADYCNKNFYMVKFDGLQKDSVIFNSRTYYNNSKDHPFHQLAVDLLMGKMAFPSTIFIDENLGLLSAVPGYFTNRGMEPILVFFNDEIYKQKQWPDFVKDFVSKIPLK